MKDRVEIITRTERRRKFSDAENPQEWLADVLDRIGKGHPINRIDELLAWNWATPQA